MREAAIELTRAAVEALLAALSCSGLRSLFRPLYGGCGSILMFHRVRPSTADGTFAPNAFLEVTPEFFAAVIELLLEHGIDIVTMSEVRRRLLTSDTARRFACLTFDDGYRDNYEFALPICRRFGVPMVVYATTGYIDRTHALWWPGIEAVVARCDTIAFDHGGRRIRLDAAGSAAKRRAYRSLAALCGGLPTVERDRMCRQLSDRSGVDFRQLSDVSLMTWDMVRAMAESGSAEIGAHSVGHENLATLERSILHDELAASRDRLAAMLQRPVEHFAYPFGGRAQAGQREFAACRDAGYATAVTTRHANLMPEHRGHLHALPRLSINGLFQRTSAVETYLSGASSALANRFARVVTL